METDTRESISIELTDKEWLDLAMAAHDHDITLNQYINNLLKKAIDAHEKLSSDDQNILNSNFKIYTSTDCQNFTEIIYMEDKTDVILQTK
jgi:hypothetical protein